MALIMSMHEESMAKVRWNDGVLSESFELKCGLKQGAIYSPCLFSLFFNFVTAWLDETGMRQRGGGRVAVLCRHDQANEGGPAIHLRDATANG